MPDTTNGGVMILELNGRESRLLEALVHIANRLLDRPFERGQEGSLVDTGCMSAGECSILALEAYGLVDLCSPPLRFGQWTDAGQKYRKDLSDRHAGEFDQLLPELSELRDPTYTPASALGVTDREALLLEAVSSMAQTYYMPECAIMALVEYDLLEPIPREQLSGRWIQGEKFENTQDDGQRLGRNSKAGVSAQN
jgi:hypothetical protein